MDQHNFDPMRSVLYRGGNSFNLEEERGEFKDDFVPIPEEVVQAELGQEIEEVLPFDPFERPELEAATQPEEAPPPFDPELGMPWLNEVNPFLVIIPKNNYKFSEIDYVSKLVLISREELKLVTNVDVDNVHVSRKYQGIVDEISGSEHIDNPVLICVTHIRRDRNDPKYTNWYLVHVLGHPDVVIKSDVNPFGGLIPLVPIQISPTKNVWDTSMVDDIKPYAEWYSAGVEAIGDRLYESLNQKVLTGAGAGMEAEEIRKLLNSKYSGEVKVSGDPSTIKLRPY